MSSVASSASIGRFINVIGIDASTTNQLTSILQTKIADKDEKNNITINEEGINIRINEDGEDNKIIINEDGIDIDVKDHGESFKMKIDEDGVNIKSNEDN